MTLSSCRNPSLAALVLVLAAGCAAHRVESSADNYAMTAVPTAATGKVVLAEDALPGRKYTVIGPIEVSVKKLTVFNKDPTREQANLALMEKAQILGANAVINIKYTAGVGLTTWGYIDAVGTAVKLTP